MVERQRTPGDSSSRLTWQLRLECLRAQQRRESPAWVGQWVPLSAKRAVGFTSVARDIRSGRAAPRFLHPASEGSRSFTPFETIYELEEVAKACRVPQVELGLGEVLEQHTKLHTTLGVLDSFSAESRGVVEEARYSTSRPLVGLELVEESVVVGSTITALASSWDLVGYGCTSGTVGLHIGASSLNWRPHSSAVTTVIFKDSSLLSSSLDGTVRRADLGRQAVLLEHGGEEAVVWMERRGGDSYLLASTGEVSLLDLRRRGVSRVIDLRGLGGLVQGSQVAAHPSDPNMFSVCGASAVRIYDMRRVKTGGDAVGELGGAFLCLRWNPRDPDLLLACSQAEASERVRAAVYSSDNLSRSPNPSQAL